MIGQTKAVQETELRTPARNTEGTRLAYLDNLKTLLIAGIIASHAVMGYAAFGSWTYQDVQESTLSPVVETIFVIAVFSLGGLFLMALFFLISGLLTQDSLQRKGDSRFVRDRLLRLGVPFAVYTLLVWPLLEFALHEPLLHQGSYWRSFTNTDPVLDSGPMWFVGVLLLYSLALVAWRAMVRRPTPVNRDLRGRDLLLLGVGVGVATFVVRIGFTADSNQPLNAHLWAWPEYIAMFGLGVAAARHGWLRPVPHALARSARHHDARRRAADAGRHPVRGAARPGCRGVLRGLAAARVAGRDDRGPGRRVGTGLGAGVRAATPGRAPGRCGERWPGAPTRRSCCKGRCSWPSP